MIRNIEYYSSENSFSSVWNDQFNYILYILYENRRKIWRLATTIKKVFLYMQYLAFLFHNLFPFPPCIALALMSFFLIDLIFCMICCAWLNTGLSWTVTMTLMNGWVSAEGNGNQGWNSCTCILMHKDGCIHF